jgi:hypothetical protein
MKNLNWTTSLMVATLFAAAINLRADEKQGANPFSGVLSMATRVEMPAKAAELISHADAKIQKQTTVDVVKAAVGLNPAGAPVVVGSIAQSTPGMAATAAATAAVLVPDQVVDIARSAVAAAPAFAGQIVEWVCRTLPTSYKKVAVAVAEIAPGSARQILAGVCAAIPTLSNSISQVLAANPNNILSVGDVLSQVSTAEVVAVASQTPEARGPTSGGPFITPSGTPTVTTPSSGGVTPNPSNYSKP